MEDSMNQEHFRQWALVELMGHQKIAGLVSEQTIAGTAFIRVDIPDKAGNTRFTRLYGASAIYCISPVDRQIAIGIALKLESEPVHRYQLMQLAGTKDHRTDHTSELASLVEDEQA